MRNCLKAMVVVLLASTVAVAQDDDFKREGDEEARIAKDALEGKAPPELQVENWLNAEGESINLKQFEGKVVLIDFWGTWCGPCRSAIPHLIELHEKHGEDGLVIIGVHTTNGGDEMAAYVDEVEIPYPVAIDVEGKTVESFAVDSFPDYYVIDRQGMLRFADLANAEVDRAIELLLEEE